jgi:hypothetical protein
MLYALIKAVEYWMGAPAELNANTNQLFTWETGVTDVSCSETSVLLRYVRNAVALVRVERRSPPRKTLLGSLASLLAIAPHTVRIWANPVPEFRL